MVCVSADLACATGKTEARSVLVVETLGVGGCDDRLCVTVGDLFRESLTCEIRVEVRVDWHLGVGLLSGWFERTALEVSIVDLRYVWVFW